MITSAISYKIVDEIDRTTKKKWTDKRKRERERKLANKCLVQTEDALLPNS